MIGKLLNTLPGGMLIFFAFAAVVVFKFTTLKIRSPRKGESFLPAIRRLGVAYREQLLITLVSPWLWAAAGAWTAFLIAYSVFVRP